MNNFYNLNLLPKKIEHHLERHYEIETNKNYYLQYIYVSDEFYKYRFTHCLNLSESLELKNLLLDEYGSHTSYEDFEYLKTSTFISFFRENTVDVPRCFRQTQSVRRSHNEIYLLKFNNYFMRHGKKLKTSNSFLSSLQSEFYNPLYFTNRIYKTNFS